MNLSAASAPAVEADAAPRRDGLGVVALIGAIATLLQVTVLSRIDVGPVEGMPNLVVVVVAAIACMRGVVVGAVAGFVCGVTVELILPGETLGVFALAYVAVGAWCGRFAANPVPVGRLTRLALATAACAAVPLWVGLIELLRGHEPSPTYVVESIAVPQAIFGLVLALPVFAVVIRWLGTPREVEPWAATA